MRVATLGSTTDDGLLEDRLSGIRAMGNGYFTTSLKPGVLPKLYSLDGQFAKAFGRIGQGPGEYEWPRVIKGRSDSIDVIDGGLRKVLNSAGVFVRAHPITRILASSIVASNGLIVGSGMIPDAERIGFALHVFSADGKYMRSMDEYRGVLTANESWRLRRVITQGPGNTLWVADRPRYRISQWDLAGTLLRTFERQVDWFPAAERTPVAGRPDLGRPPTTVVQDMRQDSRGLLWLVISVAAPDWEKWLGPPAPNGTYPNADDSRVFQTVIEVIDPARGRLLASKRVNGLMLQFITDDLVYAHRETPDGLVVADILRLSLTGLPR